MPSATRRASTPLRSSRSPRAVLVALVAASSTSCAGAPARRASPPAVAQTGAKGPSNGVPIEGDVRSADGAPVAGALVSAWTHFDLETSDPAHDTITDDRGHFALVLPPARYALTATTPGHSAAYSGVFELGPTAAHAPFAMRVGAAGSGRTVSGKVTAEGGAKVANARVIAAAETENEDEMYVVRTDADGAFALTLPAGAGYYVVADAPPHPRASAHAEAAASPITLDIALAPAPPPRPSDAQITAWLRARGTALQLSPIGALTGDGARAVAAVAGDAQLFAMGEASHGAAEFPEVRQRVFAALARDKGFTTYAIEAADADVARLDAYVVSGAGDLEEAVRAIGAWKDTTTETVALATWMRTYNADASHPKKLRIRGFDVYTPNAVTRILSYWAKVDPSQSKAAAEALAPFADVGCDRTFPALSAETRARIARGIAALLARLDTHHAAYARAAGEATWALVRQDLRVVQQATTAYDDSRAREEHMAENIAWLAQHAGAGEPIFVDAHATHVAAAGSPVLPSMGQHLRRAFGARYVAVGFAFGEGSFLALDWTHGPNAPGANAVVPFTVGAAPADTFDGALALARVSMLLVDLRASASPGVASVDAWLRAPQRMHVLRGYYDGERAFESVAPAVAFDALLYVNRITPIHPLAPRKRPDAERR